MRQTSTLNLGKGFLQLGINDIWSWTILFMRDCPVCYRMFQHPLPTRFQEHPPPGGWPGEGKRQESQHFILVAGASTTDTASTQVLQTCRTRCTAERVGPQSQIWVQISFPSFTGNVTLGINSYFSAPRTSVFLNGQMSRFTIGTPTRVFHKTPVGPTIKCIDLSAVKQKNIHATWG